MAPRSLVAPRTRRGRHAAREAALRILYEADMSDRDAVELFAARRSELKLDEQANDYAASLVERVAARRDELDAAIAALAPMWPLDQMAPLDLAILRMGLVEIEDPDVPSAVAANEAVKLARNYCDNGSRRLINGALGSYIRSKASEAGA